METEKFFGLIRQVIAAEDVDVSACNAEEKKLIEELMNCSFNYRQEQNYHEKTVQRIEKILDVLVEFAQFNFSVEIPISNEADELDGIALGLQTLGQEIEYYQNELAISNINLVEAQKMAQLGSWVYIIGTKNMTWSEEMFRIYGVEDVTPSLEKFYIPYSDKSAKRLQELFQRAVNYHEPYQLTAKILIGTKQKYVDVQAKPVFENGEIVKIAGTVMDVTERHLAQEKLELANIDLEKKVAERTKDLEGFSYSVSHDLRAPLRSILGFSNILKETYQDSLGEEGNRLIEIISRNANKMSTLIEELLTFSRVGVTVPTFHPLSLNDLLKSTWQDTINIFPDKEKVSVEFEEMPDICGAVGLLNQVFCNLFSNALKYSSKKDKIEITVRVVSQENECVTLVIEDNGCGFNMKYHEKLFGVFQRLHSEDEFSGTGVGLALVKRIVDKHHGKIWADSEINVGSKFYITLPTINPNEVSN